MFHGLFLSGPAIGADLFPVNTDRLQHSLKGLVGQRVEAELLADGVQQTLSAAKYPKMSEANSVIVHSDGSETIQPQAAAVVLDGNLTAETITWLGAHCSAPLFADPVSVTKAERMRASLGALHTFKPNLTEGQNLTGESTPEGVVAALLAQGVQRVFLSMGAEGILAGTRGETVYLPCLPTRMVNTTGGGDAVMAALVWAYLAGLDLRESAAAALRAGKATVEYPGTNNPDLGVLVHG